MDTAVEGSRRLQNKIKMATTTNGNATGSSSGKQPPVSVQMKHVNLEKDHVSEAQRKHMEMMNERLVKHIHETKRLSRRNALVGVVCAAGVIGICILFQSFIFYIYTIALTF